MSMWRSLERVRRERQDCMRCGWGGSEQRAESGRAVLGEGSNARWRSLGL